MGEKINWCSIQVNILVWCSLAQVGFIIMTPSLCLLLLFTYPPLLRTSWVNSTYKFMLGHRAPSTSTLEGQCHHIMNSVKLIVVEICLKVRQCQLLCLFFMLSVFKNEFCHTIVLCYKENSVRMVLLRERTPIFSTENYRMNALLMCSLSVDY